MIADQTFSQHPTTFQSTRPWSWDQVPIVLIAAGILCLWGLLTQAANPRSIPILQAQVIAMGMGMVFISLVKDLPLPSIRTGKTWAPWAVAFVQVGLLWGMSMVVRPPRYLAMALLWINLPILLILTLVVLKQSSSNLTWTGIGVLYYFAAWSCVQSRTPVGVVILSVSVIFLAAWKKQPMIAGLLTALTIPWYMVLGTKGVYPPLMRFGTYFLPDPLGRDFAADQVRQLFARAGWTGIDPAGMHQIPFAHSHFALGLFVGLWGWVGIALWGGLIAGLLVAAFRIAFRHRDSVEGDLLATLSFVFSVVIALSVAHALGLAVVGISIPLMGVDPGLTLVALCTMGLGANLHRKGAPNETNET